MPKKAKPTTKTSAPRRAASTDMPIDAVVHFVHMLRKRNHAAKFIASAKESGATVTVPREARKVIKDFASERGIDLCPGADPWKC